MKTLEATKRIYMKSPVEATVITIALLLIIFNLSGILDLVSKNYFDETLKTSALAFFSAKLLNGVISTLQSVQVSTVILSINPGEALDPFNDLVEYFSEILMLTTASLGIQKILLGISGSWALRLLATIAIALLAILILLPRFTRNEAVLTTSKYLYKTVVIILALRFMVPFVAIASSSIEGYFLRTQFNQNIEQLNNAAEAAKVAETAIDADSPEKDTVGDADKVPSPQSRDAEIEEEDGFMARLNRFKDSTANSISNAVDNTMNFAAKANPDKVITDLSNNLDGAVKSILDLTALFILQVIILPLTFLAGFIWLVRSLFGVDIYSQYRTRKAERHGNKPVNQDQEFGASIG